VKDRTKEQPPSTVPETAQQGGDIRARWAWVEPTVWTERMLATLETGIEGGKWFRLIDKVWSPKNLAGSLQKVVAKGGSAGIDNQSAVPRLGFSWERGRFSGALFRGNWHVGYGVI
jgi:hypothetical protein